MLSGNGTIDYDVEAHTLDAHKTSAARQESTTRNLHKDIWLRSKLQRSGNLWQLDNNIGWISDSERSGQAWQVNGCLDTVDGDMCVFRWNSNLGGSITREHKGGLPCGER